MDLPFIFKSIKSQFSSRGFVGVSEMLLHRVYIRYQDWKYGIHTEAVIPASDLGFANPEYHDYGASDWHYLRKLLKRLHLHYQSHVFVDFGAGMGRAVIVAASFPFRRVIGVEISPQLASIAGENVMRAQNKLACSNVVIANTDATKLVIEPAMSIFYFFNPFHGHTLEVVLEAIRASLTRYPREAFVICRLPPTSEFEAQMSQVEWLRKESETTLKDGIKYWILASRTTDGPRI